MAFSYSKLGGKYLLTDIENTDQAYHSELQRMYKHLHCDCGSSHTNWVTLRRGEEKFVCITCAQTLRADSKNKIKSAMGTYRWHPDEMEAIRTKYSEYSEEHGAANLEEMALTTSQQKKKKTKKKKKKRTTKMTTANKTTATKMAVTKTELDSDNDPFGFFASFLD